MKKKKGNGSQVAEALVLVLQIGINMLVPIFVCLVAGYYIGKAIDASYPMVIGIFVGIVAGYNGVYKLLKGYIKNEKDKKTQ